MSTLLTSPFKWRGTVMAFIHFVVLFARYSICWLITTRAWVRLSACTQQQCNDQVQHCDPCEKTIATKTTNYLCCDFRLAVKNFAENPSRPDYRKYLSPEILSIPYKWFAPQTPPKKTKTTTTEKSGKTFKQRPSKGTYPGWIQRKISRSVFHNMQITSEPLCSHPCTRLKIQIPMHSISWGCPKIGRHCDPISLLINTFGIHLEPGCKSHEQVIQYRTAKNVQKQTTVLFYF